MTSIAMKSMIAYEHGLASLVLATVVEATPQLGRPPSRGFIASVLTGSVSRDMVSVDAHRLTTFGSLADMSVIYVCALIDRMIERGFLENLRSRRAIVCSARGRQALEMNEETEGLGVLAGTVDTNKLDLAVRSGFVDALRRFRAEKANEEETIEARIFSEACLREIATQRPVSLAGVQDIIGEKKGEKLGPEILRITAEHDSIIDRLKVRA
jgi:ATP-dependent DNA helicase RecQ